MIKTDVKNYYLKRPGIVIQDNPVEKQRYMKQKQLNDYNQEMQSQINNMSEELRQLKELVGQLIKDK